MIFYQDFMCLVIGMFLPTTYRLATVTESARSHSSRVQPRSCAGFGALGRGTMTPI